jgi:hypothetical protein
MIDRKVYLIKLNSQYDVVEPSDFESLEPYWDLLDFKGIYIEKWPSLKCYSKYPKKKKADFYFVCLLLVSI